MNESVKVCTGPAHVGPTRIPLDTEHWYFHQSGPRQGMPTTRCRLCTNWTKLISKTGPHGWVRLTKAMQALTKELVDRCGSYGAVYRHHGVRAETLRLIVVGETGRVQKKTAGRILVALSEQRKYDRRNGTNVRFMEARRAQARIDERLERDECG